MFLSLKERSCNHTVLRSKTARTCHGICNKRAREAKTNTDQFECCLDLWQERNNGCNVYSEKDAGGISNEGQEVVLCAHGIGFDSVSRTVMELAMRKKVSSYINDLNCCEFV